MTMHAHCCDPAPHWLKIADRPDCRIGHTVLQVQVADSTNAMLLELGRGGAGDGTVLVANHQSFGRGKGERRWFSRAEGSLCASVLLRPRHAACDLSLATLVAAVALHDAIQRFGVEASIKWPNDILVGNRKVCGILAEAHATVGGDIEFAVVGFGLNVSIAAGQFPPELRQIATSMQAETDRSVDRHVVFDACMAAFETWVDRWDSQGFGPIAQAWRARSSTLGQHVDVLDGNERRCGLAVALAADGALVLRDAAGHEHHIHSGDIRTTSAPAETLGADR